MGLRLAEGDRGVRARGAAGRRPSPSSWGAGRTIRPGPLSSLRIALYRLGRGWKLLLGVGAGILIAVILICTVPLYDALVAGIQLQRALATSSPQDRNLQVQ